MCSPQLAIAAVSVAGTVMQYQDDRAAAQTKANANETARRNADKAYLEDISRIDMERTMADREKRKEDFAATQLKKKEAASALNTGFGSPLASLQNAFFDADVSIAANGADYTADLVKIGWQQRDAYGTLQRTYAGLATPRNPSKIGAALKIAGAGAEYWAATAETDSEGA